MGVRKTDGSMVVEKIQFISAGKKNKAFRLPVVRGAVGLFESLALGYKALSRSAEIAMEEERATRPETADPEKQKAGDRLVTIASFAFAIIISVGLFEYGPMWLVSKVCSKRVRPSFQYVRRKHQDCAVSPVSLFNQPVEGHAEDFRIPRRRAQGDLRL